MSIEESTPKAPTTPTFTDADLSALRRVIRDGVAGAINDPGEVGYRSKLGIFLHWHGEDSFWREIYVRAVSAILAATLIAAGAAGIGLIPWRSLFKGLGVVGSIGAVVAILGVVANIIYAALFEVRWFRRRRARRNATAGGNDEDD